MCVVVCFRCYELLRDDSFGAKSERLRKKSVGNAAFGAGTGGIGVSVSYRSVSDFLFSAPPLPDVSKTHHRVFFVYVVHARLLRSVLLCACV